MSSVTCHCDNIQSKINNMRKKKQCYGKNNTCTFFSLRMVYLSKMMVVVENEYLKIKTPAAQMTLTSFGSFSQCTLSPSGDGHLFNSVFVVPFRWNMSIIKYLK